MSEHPMQPPPELARNLAEDAGYRIVPDWLLAHIQTAYAAGADAELEACCDVIYLREEQPLCGGTAEWLRAARRPKPPSMKQQAIQRLGDIEHGAIPSPDDYSAIRRALESLPND